MGESKAAMLSYISSATASFSNKTLVSPTITGTNFIQRSISSPTGPVMFGASQATDYVAFVNIGASGHEPASTAVGTVALLHCDGASGSTTITDSGVLQSNWTAAGNAQVSTAQSVFGGSSIYFDGTTDYVRSTAPSSNFAFASGDFCVEFRLFITALKTAFLYDARSESTGGNNRVSIYVNSSGLLRLNVSGVDRISGATAMSINTWYHVALSRSGTSTKLWLNGAQEGSTWTDTTVYESDRVVLGANAINYIQGFEGHLDDIRISKVARYTGAFTPPAAPHPNPPSIRFPTAVSNTNDYRIRNVGTETILLAGASGQTFDGTALPTMATNATARYISDGSNWRTV